MIDPMQQMRLAEHTIDINDNLIIYGNLENGTLRIYEQIGGPVSVQQLITRYMTIKNAVLLAEVVINSNWKDEGVFIHKILCEYGHENLVEPMINQVLHFANYYSQYDSVAITDREYEKWFPHAKDALKDFQKINRVYECYLDGHREE